MPKQKPVPINTTSSSHRAYMTMSPAPLSPNTKQSGHLTSSSQHEADGIRKRVCKACDRCRLKKSKCDGSSPCSRSKADNAICVFGERKRSHDKIYPKGYVEVLEQQQGQLVSGLQELYHRLLKASAWESSPLEETNGHPLTHDILKALNLLEAKHDGSNELEVFEENCDKLQSRLLANGAGYSHRRGSVSSESDHSHHDRSRTTSGHDSPVDQKPPGLFKDNFNFPSNTSSPLTRSPVPRLRLPPQPSNAHPPVKPVPLRLSSFNNNDPQLYTPDWVHALTDMNDPSSSTSLNDFQSDFDNFNLPWTNQQQSPSNFDSFNPNQFQTFQPQMGGYLGPEIAEMPPMDGMEIDFSKFVQPQEVMT